MKKRNIYLLITVIITVCFPLLTTAQPPLIPINDVPIDGGLSLLLAAGVGYGIKKYRDARRK